MRTRKVIKLLETQKYLVKAIKAELAAKNLTRSGLADFLSINRSYLSRKLSDEEKSFNTCELDKIAAYLGMSSWQLYALAEERAQREEANK